MAIFLDITGCTVMAIESLIWFESSYEVENRSLYNGTQTTKSGAAKYRNIW